MRNVSFYLICLILATLIPHAAAAEFKKTKIAILDFQLQGEGYETADMGKIVAEWLITALVREGRFDVIERRLLAKILQEQKLVMTGVVDQESATKLGKLLGVKVIISGSVLRLRDFLEVNARIIDVESASIIAAESVKSRSAERLEELIGRMAEKIIRDFPLKGYIVHRKNGNIVLDLGKPTGIKPGMRFIVFREGNVIKHPKTGEILDIEKKETGVIEVATVMDKISEAVIVEENEPGAITYGQMVKSVSEHLASAPKSEPALPKTGKGRLYINTDPEEARVRILNIGPRYVRGMELAPGNYHVEVSAPGYGEKTEWVSLGPGEEKTVFVRIEALPVSEPINPPPGVEPGPMKQPMSSEVLRVVNMLGSSDSAKKRKAARIIHKKYRKDPEVLRAVNAELLYGYKKRPGDRNHVDAMAWLCNILGDSGYPEYKSTLITVSENARNRKLKKYGLKNARKYK